MPDYKSLLRSIGLNDSEAAVYLASLETGPAQPQLLVKKSGFSRPATYLAIEQLVRKGLMSSVQKGKRYLYSAEPPERLVHFGRTRIEDMNVKIGEVESVIDNLRLLQKGERPTVKFFEGPEGLKAILRDLVASKPESTEEIANIDALYRVFTGKELQEAQKILDKSKAKGRALLSGKVSSVRENIEAKLLPKELEFDGDLLVYGDKVAMVSYTDRIMGVVVENPAMAQTYRVLFELAWRGAKDIPEIKKAA